MILVIRFQRLCVWLIFLIVHLSPASSRAFIVSQASDTPWECSVDPMWSTWEWSKAGPLHRHPDTQDVQIWRCSRVVCCHFSHSEKEEVTWYPAKGWFICSTRRMEPSIPMLSWESSEMSLPSVSFPRLVLCYRGKRWEAEGSSVSPSPSQDSLKCSFQFGFLHRNIDCEPYSTKRDSDLYKLNFVSLLWMLIIQKKRKK